MTTTLEILRSVPYFADLESTVLDPVCADSEQVVVEAGEVLIEEGSSSKDMFVVREGELRVEKAAGGKRVSIARLGEGDVIGEAALLEGAPRNATVVAVTRAHLIRIPATAFERLLQDPRVVRRMLRTVTARLRQIEVTIRHDERMSALGRMAAQLMHELNNPAAAIASSARALADQTRRMSESSPGQAAPQGDPVTYSALTRASIEQAVAEALADLGVADHWELAPALVAQGWTPDSVRRFAESLPQGERVTGVSGMARLTSIEALAGEVAMAADRIAELVRVVKDFSFVDRAPIQELDLRDGIEDTLTLLKPKLRGVDVVTRFQAELPTVHGPGRDLNQVWTNLIDNAAAALDGDGTLTITAGREDDDVAVSITDDGPGIPEEVADKIFDPFFTTKEPGSGTGLGLYTVYSIIERLGGTIEMKSDDRGTTFTVKIPIGSRSSAEIPD